MNTISPETTNKVKDELQLVATTNMAINTLLFILAIFVFRNTWNVGIVYISHMPKIDYGQAGSILVIFWILSRIFTKVLAVTAETAVEQWLNKMDRIAKIVARNNDSTD